MRFDLNNPDEMKDDRSEVKSRFPQRRNRSHVSEREREGPAEGLREKRRVGEVAAEAMN